jgi:hypothetical protein
MKTAETVINGTKHTYTQQIKEAKNACLYFDARFCLSPLSIKSKG